MNIRDIALPRFYTSDFPEDEREALQSIDRNIRTCVGLVGKYHSLLKLFQHSYALRQQMAASLRSARDLKDQNQYDQLRAEIRTPEDWVEVAARQGAMVLYTFAMLVQANDGLIGKVPTIRSKMDSDSLAKSRDLFARAFPSIERVRLSAAHPGEIGKNSDDIAKHSTRNEIQTPFLDITDGVGMIDSNLDISVDKVTYSSTIKRQLVSYSLSQETADAFLETVILYLATFNPWAQD